MSRMACTKGACSASSTASFAAVTSSAERSSTESADTPLKSDRAPKEAFAGIFPLSREEWEGAGRVSARGRARRSGGGETRRPSSAGRRGVGPRREIDSRHAALERTRTVGPRTDETRGGSGEDARGDAPVLERDGHGVRACTTPLARIRPRLATSRARVCGASVRSKRSKARLRRQSAWWILSQGKFWRERVNPILLFAFLESQTEGKRNRRSKLQAFSSRVRKPKMLFLFFTEWQRRGKTFEITNRRRRGFH